MNRIENLNYGAKLRRFRPWFPDFNLGVSQPSIQSLCDSPKITFPSCVTTMTSTTDKSAEDLEAFVEYPKTTALWPFRKSYLAGKPAVEKLDFHGTVKIHGCNISILLFGPEKWQMQSRNRILSANEDQYGVYAKLNDAPWGALAKEILRIHECLKLEGRDAEKKVNKSTIPEDNTTKKLRELSIGSDRRPNSTGAEHINDSERTTGWENIMIVGEWAGKGIQKSVGVCNLARFLTIFNIRVGKTWQDVRKYESISLPTHRIFNICDFPTYPLTIDLADLTDVDRAERQLTEMVERIDKECPVSAYFGVKGTGEGLVFTYHPPEPSCVLYHFKVKGESHAVVKKDRIDNVPKEKAARINAFVEYAMTEARLDQGLEYLKEMLIPVEPESTAKYIKWVTGDILNEESDKLEEMDLNERDIKSELSKAIRLGWTARLREIERS